MVLMLATSLSPLALIILVAAVASPWPTTASATSPEGVVFSIELNRASTAAPICESGTTGPIGMAWPSFGVGDPVFTTIDVPGEQSTRLPINEGPKEEEK